MKGDTTMDELMEVIKSAFMGFVADFVEQLLAHLESIFSDAE